MTNDIRIRPRAPRDDAPGTGSTDARTPWSRRPYIAWPAAAALLTALLFLFARINAPAVFRFDEDPGTVRAAVEKMGSVNGSGSWQELTCDGHGNFRLRPGEYRLALRSGPFTLFDGRMVLDGYGVWHDGETEFDFDRLTRRIDVFPSDSGARIYLDGMRADTDAAAQMPGPHPAISGVGKSDQTVFRLPDQTFCVFAVSGRRLSDIRFLPVDRSLQTETVRTGEYPHEFLPGIDAENDEVILAFFRRLRAPGWTFWETYAPGKKEELVRLFVETFCEKAVETETETPSRTVDTASATDAKPADPANETAATTATQTPDVLDTIFQEAEDETIPQRLADLEAKIQEEIVQAAMKFVQESRDDPETGALLRTLLADEFTRLNLKKTESAKDETVPETSETTKTADEDVEKQSRELSTELSAGAWRFYCIEGYCLMHEGRPEEAKTVLELAVATASDHALPRVLLARALGQLNAFGEARAAVDRALECDDVVRADALTVRASLELREAERTYDEAEHTVLVEKSRKALEDLNAAAACDRVFPETFFLRSLVRSALGREKEAGEDWTVFEGRLGDRGPAESDRTLKRAEKLRQRWKLLVKTESWGEPPDENH